MDKKLQNLISRAAAGDKDAFSELYVEKAKYIYYSALHFCKNPQDAEDVAQEVAVRMFRALPTLKSPEFFDTWLYSIVYRECRALFRKRNAKKRSLNMLTEHADEPEEDREEFLPKEYAENVEKSEALRKAVERLPAKRRTVIVLYYFDNLSCAQIAEITGTSVSTVTSTLTKAKAAIKKDLETQFGEIPAVAKAFVSVPVLSKVLQADADKLFIERIATNMANVSALPAAPVKNALLLRVLTGVAIVTIGGGILAGAWMFRQKPPASTSDATPSVEQPNTGIVPPVDFAPGDPMPETQQQPVNSGADSNEAPELEALKGVFALSLTDGQGGNILYPKTAQVTVKGRITLPDSLLNNCTLFLCEDGNTIAATDATQDSYCFEPVSLQAGHNYYISATYSGGTVTGAAPVTAPPQSGVSTIDLIIVEK